MHSYFSDKISNFFDGIKQIGGKIACECPFNLQNVLVQYCGTSFNEVAQWLESAKSRFTLSYSWRAVKMVEDITDMDLVLLEYQCRYIPLMLEFELTHESTTSM